MKKKSEVESPKSVMKPKAESRKRKAVLKPEEENNSAIETQHSEVKNKSEIENPTSEIRMEVHHHPQLEHKPKPWKEYLLEGLMIFLAVTMGFFAESLREHITDRDHERQSMESLVKTVISDTLQLQRIIKQTNKSIKILDGFIDLKSHDLSKDEYKNAFYLGVFNGVFVDTYFKSNDAALQQLNASGSLRLIRNRGTVDSIFKYELINKQITDQEADNYFAFKEVINRIAKVTDITFFKDTAIVRKIRGANETAAPFIFSGRQLPPIDNDKQTLKEIFNYTSLLSGADDSYNELLKTQLHYGRNLITYLKKEYDLE